MLCVGGKKKLFLRVFCRLECACDGHCPLPDEEIGSMDPAETSNEHRRKHKKHVFCVCFVVAYVCYVVWKLQKHVFYECFVVWRPKTRVLRVFCGLEAPGRSKGVPGRARAVGQGAPEQESTCYSNRLVLKIVLIRARSKVRTKNSPGVSGGRLFLTTYVLNVVKYDIRTLRASRRPFDNWRWVAWR